MKKTSKKLVKPRKFGIGNEVYSFGFDVDKSEGTIDFDTSADPTEKCPIWFGPKEARWLADKLVKAAEYLESLEEQS